MTERTEIPLLDRGLQINRFGLQSDTLQRMLANLQTTYGNNRSIDVRSLERQSPRPILGRNPLIHIVTQRETLHRRWNRRIPILSVIGHLITDIPELTEPLDVVFDRSGLRRHRDGSTYAWLGLEAQSWRELDYQRRAALYALEKTGGVAHIHWNDERMDMNVVVAHPPISASSLLQLQKGIAACLPAAVTLDEASFLPDPRPNSSFSRQSA